MRVHCRKHSEWKSQFDITFQDWLLLSNWPNVLLFWSISCILLFLGGVVTLPVPLPGRAELFTVGYWMSRGLEWSGVGCGSHIPPETQITLQETSALQDTHCLTPWFINILLYGSHTLSQRDIKISATRSKPVLHLYPFLTFLPSCHSQTLDS